MWCGVRGIVTVWLQLNAPTQMWGVASLPLVAAYPLMKRVTAAPQVRVT